MHALHAGHHLRRERHLLGADLAVVVGVEHGEGPLGHTARDLGEEGRELVRGQRTIPVGIVLGVQRSDARLEFGRRHRAVVVRVKGLVDRVVGHTAHVHRPVAAALHHHAGTTAFLH